MTYEAACQEGDVAGAVAAIDFKTRVSLSLEAVRRAHPEVRLPTDLDKLAHDQELYYRDFYSRKGLPLYAGTATFPEIEHRPDGTTLVTEVRAGQDASPKQQRLIVARSGTGWKFVCEEAPVAVEADRSRSTLPR